MEGSVYVLAVNVPWACLPEVWNHDLGNLGVSIYVVELNDGMTSAVHSRSIGRMPRMLRSLLQC